VSPLTNEGTDLASTIANGQTVVNGSSPLTRLNYFDGKFLRADDLKREQGYLRQLVQFSNQGLGAGVVYGLDTTLDRQAQLSIGPGLAMDSSGQTLLVGSNVTLDIAALIDASRRITTKAKSNGKTIIGNADFADCVAATAAPGDIVGAAGSLYVICIGHAESLCGTEDVYGRLCEDACVTATDRPYIVEGVVVRALPLTLNTALATSKAVALLSTHLRSLVASAYFEDERHVVESLISGAGLATGVWCAGAELSAVGCVPLAVVGRAGATTTFLDTWTVRRERMEAPSKRYWAWRMAMRPWDVYLAHILQFQCQLHEVLGGATDGGSTSPCATQQQALNDASQYLRDFSDSYARHIEALSKISDVPAAFQTNDALFRLQGGAADLARLRANIDGAIKNVLSGPRSRVLINGGIMELPSAGYLPVVPGTITVNEQVRRLLGEGLDLRFCIVRPDFVPHALEEAQHMERISLLTGLDNPQAKPAVDILVPDGTLLSTVSPSLAGFDTQVRLLPALAGSLVGGTVGSASTNAASAARALVVHGAGRADSSAGAAFHFAGAQEVDTPAQVVGIANNVKEFVAATQKKRETILRAAMRTATDTKAAPRDTTSSSQLLSAISFQPNFAASLGGNTPPKPVVGMWVTMRTERDPFALNVADSTPVSVEFALTSQSTTAVGVVNHTMVRVRAFATLSVTQSALAGATGTRMTGHVSGTYSTQLFLETATPADTTKPFDADITLLRTGNAASGTLHALLGNTDATFQWVADASWGGTPLEATLKLSMLVGAKLQAAGLPQQLDVLAASALASSNALAEGNALRLLSNAALGILGDELTRANQNGSAFVDVAARLLFPPPAPPVDDLTVRPMLDWVLFQRRRTKLCAASTPQSVPTPPRRYQLFTVHAKSQREVDLIKQSLNSASEFVPQFQRVDVLEFASGAATLVTPVDALLSDWSGAGPGNTLAYAAAGTNVTTDATLTAPRLARVVSAIAPVTPLDPNAGAVEVLAQVPSTLDTPGTDGVIVLVTLDVVRLSFQNIYHVTLDARTKALLAKNMLDEIIKQPLTIDLGAQPFPDGSSTFDPAVAATLNNAYITRGGGGFPEAVISFAKPDDTTGGDDTLILARGRSIASAVGGSPNTLVEKHDIEGPWPVGPTSSVITIIGVEPAAVVRNALVIFASVDGAHYPAPDAPAARVTFSNNQPTDDALTALMKSLTPNQPVRGVTLAVIAPPVDADANLRLREVSNALVATGHPAPLRMVTSTLSDKDRAELLRSAHNIDGLDEVIFLEPQGG
jgi:hypothetical protein